MIDGHQIGDEVLKEKGSKPVWSNVREADVCQNVAKSELTSFLIGS